MNSDLQWFKRNNYIFLISFLILFTFVVLFLLRDLDDNRLTNWGWAFLYADPARIFLILIFSILSAYFLLSLPFIDKHPALFLFGFSFAISSLFWREPEVILDASRYFTQAKHLEVYGIEKFIKEWGRDINVWTDMPLIPFLYGLIFRLFGESRIYIQAFTTLLFSLTVVLTYNIGKTLWKETVGFYGGLLLLGIPYLFSQIPLMLVDVPAMFFLTLAVFAFIKALEHGGLWVLLSSITVFLAFYSKYSTWLMLSILIIIFLVYLKTALVIPPQNTLETNPPSPPFTKGGMGGLRRQGRTVFYRGSITILISGILIGVVFWYKSDVFMSQIGLLLDYQRPGLRRWSESFVSTFLFQIHPFITIAAGYSVYSAIRKKDLKHLIILWMVLLVFLFQIKRIRYIIMIFPMFSLMASYGIMQIKNREMVKFFALCIVCSSIVVAVFAYLPMTEKISLENLRDAGKYIDSLDGGTVEVFTSQTGESEANIAVSVPILDVFTSKKINYEYVRTMPIDPQETKTLPLRFTWEYKNPDYYSEVSKKGDSAVVALISDDKTLKLPAYIESRIRDYRRVKRFTISDEMFRFQVFVSVYSRQP